MKKLHNRNAHVWEQIMQQRVNRIVAKNERIAKGILPRPASYLDLSECSYTTTQATGQLTIQDLQRLITTLKDEVRAGEAQSYYEHLYYRPVILPTPWRMLIGGVL